MNQPPSIGYGPIEKTSAVEAVERRLRSDILTGRLRPGEKLPPERDLAAALGVNRLTLRSALGRLSAAGLLASQQGDGNRILDYRLHGGLERLPELAEAFIWDPDMVGRLAADLLALRRLVAVEASGLAAIRASEGDLTHLLRLAEEQSRRLVNREAFIEGDFAFMRAVLRIAGNVAFELAFNTVVQFGRKHADLLGLMFEDPETICQGYESLIALLRSGDAEAARQVVRLGLEHHDRKAERRIREHLRRGERGRGRRHR